MDFKIDMINTFKRLKDKNENLQRDQETIKINQIEILREKNRPLNGRSQWMGLTADWTQEK